MELFAAIRRDARVDGFSIRELADRYHVHRGAVRQALASAIPPTHKTPTRTSPRLEPFKTLARLVDDHGATPLSYSTVRNYVANAARR